MMDINFFLYTVLSLLSVISLALQWNCGLVTLIKKLEFFFTWNRFLKMSNRAPEFPSTKRGSDPLWLRMDWSQRAWLGPFGVGRRQKRNRGSEIGSSNARCGKSRYLVESSADLVWCDDKTETETYKQNICSIWF